MSVLVVLVSVGGYALYRYYDGKLTVVSIRLPGVGREAAGATRADGPQNFLLVGSDTRSFVGGQRFQAAQGSVDFVAGQRSDTMILVHVPAGAQKATLVSFPRDSYVQIPAYRPAGAAADRPPHMAKLNEAFSDGGAPLLVSVLQTLTGLPIDHYVQVDFGGFQKMVDALGGLSLCVGSTRHDKDSGDYLTAGTHPHVTGAQTLAFVRDRKGLTNGDIDRIKDQQYFLAQMLKQTLSAGTLTNPFRINAFLTALTSNVTVDSSFGFGQIRTLADRLRHLDPAHVTFTTIPFRTDNGTRTFGGLRQSVVLLDPPADDALFAKLRADSQPPTPSASAHSGTAPAAPTPLLVPPDAVRVSVRNASTTPGLASRTADQLRGVGFIITDVGTDPPATSAVAGPQIRYSPDRADSARTLAAAVPGSTPTAVPSGHNLVQLIVTAPITTKAITVQPNIATRRQPAPPTPTTPPLTAATAACAP